MNAKQALILGALFIAALAGVAVVKNQKQKDQPQAQDGGWARYEGPFVRFVFPKSWKPMYQHIGKTNERSWVVYPPDYMRDDTGAVRIIGRANEKETRPLDRIFDLKQWPRHKLVNQPKKVSVKNGRCIAYSMEESKDIGAEMKIQAYCSDSKGLPYNVWATIGDYLQAGKPTDNVRQNAKVYEKLLTSLEFL